MRNNWRWIGCVAAIGLALAGLSNAAEKETRYHQFTRKAKGSEGAVKPIAATFFGGSGAEEFVAAGLAGDGNVVVFGNAWGPDFPDLPELLVMGADHYKADLALAPDTKDKDRYANPNMTGFMLVYTPDLKQIVRAARFGWAGSTITFGFVEAGGIVFSGRTSAEARPDVELQPNVRIVAPPEGAESGGADLYLAHFGSPDSGGNWGLVLEKAEKPSTDWAGRIGKRPAVRAGLREPTEIVFQAWGRLFVINTDGSNMRELGPSGNGVLLAVDPKTGAMYVGADENTRTGREPWRRPFLRKFDRDGKQVWEIWRWDSKRVGEDKYRLVSDSSVRGVERTPDGDLMIVGWSDGGNSVFHRQPTDLDAEASFKSGFIDSLWGAGVGSFMRLIRISDDAKPAFKAGTVWSGFRLKENKPAGASISDLAILPNGRAAIVGGSGFALIETPDAWVKTFPEGAGGSFLSIFNPDLSELLFSTSLPAVSGLSSVTASGSKLIVTGSAAAPKEGDRVPVITEGAVQANHGGSTDGYLLLVEAK